ncbi:MAG: glycosyltransferase, partial [Phenylobacterium sp.]
LPPQVEIAAERGAAGLAGFLRARAGYYEAVVVSRPHNMHSFLKARQAAPRFHAPLIYDAEAIFALRDPAADSGRAVRRELALAEPAAVVLAVSEADARRFRSAGKADVRVLGHALEPRPTPQAFEARRDLLFVGALDEDGSPNADSLVYFVEEVMPLLDGLIGADWRLRVAGRDGAPRVRGLAGPRVALLGPVEDLWPLYGESRLFIAPTRFAAGLPMKVHEAAAAGLPVAATTLLAGQLGWSDGVELLAADGPEAFARACQRLATEPKLWSRLRVAALARVARDCSPQAFRRTVAEALAAARAAS